MNINTHIHTPYSFSAFESIDQAFKLATAEGVNILGINDFFVTDGYDEFYRLAKENNIYPLFNVEFIGLLEKEQKATIRVNDPGNPGRTYFCGKGLRYPFSLSEANRVKLDQVVKESQEQVKKMIELLSQILLDINAPFSLTFDEIISTYAKELVRERHIAKALRVSINKHFNSDQNKKEFLKNLYSGKESDADLSNNNALEGELRSQLLKAGGKAFVPEDAASFLPISELIDIIINAGGIPCYPVLLDDKNGNYTEFEKDKNALYERLTSLGIGAVELIPGRNNIKHLKDFVRFFNEKDFVITFGTEHNTPELSPLTVTAGGNIPLDNFLSDINREGACIIAAHQHLLSEGKEGFMDPSGRCKKNEKPRFIELGQGVINKYFKQNNRR